MCLEIYVNMHTQILRHLYGRIYNTIFDPNPSPFALKFRFV